MKKAVPAIMVSLIMIAGILGITNPGNRQPFRLFDNGEGKVTHNYFIFSIYQQLDAYSTSHKGTVRVYRRYMGIASGFYEISPLHEEE